VGLYSKKKIKEKQTKREIQAREEGSKLQEAKGSK